MGDHPPVVGLSRMDCGAHQSTTTIDTRVGLVSVVGSGDESAADLRNRLPYRSSNHSAEVQRQFSRNPPPPNDTHSSRRHTPSDLKRGKPVLWSEARISLDKSTVVSTMLWNACDSLGCQTSPVVQRLCRSWSAFHVAYNLGWALQGTSSCPAPCRGGFRLGRWARTEKTNFWVAHCEYPPIGERLFVRV